MKAAIELLTAIEFSKLSPEQKRKVIEIYRTLFFEPRQAKIKAKPKKRKRK